MVPKRLAHHVYNHVVPTKHNGFVPHLLKERAMWSLLGVGIALFGFSQFLHVTNYLNINAEIFPTTIVTLTNTDRSALGLSPLSVSPTLVAAAKLKAEDMVRNDYFAHTSPIGVTPWHWFGQAGYTFLYAGENLAVNFNDSADVETAWLNSPAHKANIMSNNFTQIGIAIAKGQYGGNPTTFVVELFGMPAVAKASNTLHTPETLQPLAPSSAPQPQSTAPTVAGESTQSPEANLRIVDDSDTYTSVKNTDPTLEQQTVTNTKVPTVPWFSRMLLNMDTYIGLILQTIIVVLIVALTMLVTREYQKHHRLHIFYGILMTIILTSFLFIGRIGVFAAASPSMSSIVDQ